LEIEVYYLTNFKVSVFFFNFKKVDDFFLLIIIYRLDLDYISQISSTLSQHFLPTNQQQQDELGNINSNFSLHDAHDILQVSFLILIFFLKHFIFISL